MPPRLATATLLLLGATLPAGAQDPLAAAAEDLVRREKLRAGVEAAFETFRQPVEDGDQHLDNAIIAIEGLVALGPEVVPYLVNELEQERGDTYDFTAWALGMMPGHEAVQALRDGVARGEMDGSRAALPRKAMCCWALGLHGQADAVELLMSGRHRAGHWAIHSNCPVLEVVAAFTAPESLPLLLGQLERLNADEHLQGERRWVLRALRRLADARAVPDVVALLDDPLPHIRYEAAYTLGTHASPEARAALSRALADEERAVRRTAAMSLERLRVPGFDAARALERLEVETDALTRGALYRLVDAYGDRGQRERLYGYEGRDDALDRQLLVEAVAPRGDRRSYETIDRALADPDNGVAATAVEGLVKLGTRDAETRLAEALPRASWTVAQVLAERIAEEGIERAAPAAAERLLAAAAVTEPRALSSAVITADKLGHALVRLGYHQAARKLHRAAEELAATPSTAPPARPETLEIVAVYRRTAQDLDLIHELGAGVEAWVEQLKAPEPERRSLAITRLAKIGTEPASAALAAAFSGAEPADRTSIMRELVGVDTPSARALIELVLLDPEFDPAPWRETRDWAAWAARRLGGDSMRQLLESAVERRNGRDARVLFYAALVEPARPELLGRYRLPRMRYLGHARGAELEALDWLVRFLAAGQSVAEYDVPPSRLVFL